jgi:hypothetical protein
LNIKLKETVATNNPMNYIHQKIVSSLLQISKHDNKHLRHDAQIQKLQIYHTICNILQM